MGFNMSDVSIYDNYIDVHNDCAGCYSKASGTRKASRIACIEHLAKSIFLEMGYRGSVAFRLSEKIDGIPSTDGKIIYCSHLLLLTQRDIPKEYRIANDQDPKLGDDKFLLNFAHWSDYYFGLSTERTALTLREKEAVRIALKLLLNPDQHANMIRFILGHEVSHIINKDCDSHKSPDKILLSSFFYSKFTLLAILAIVGLALGAHYKGYLPDRKIWKYALAGYATAVALSILYQANHNRGHESKADLASATQVQGAREGGIYLFETLKRHQSTSPLWIYTPFGTNLALSLTHPSEGARVDYLKKAKYVEPPAAAPVVVATEDSAGAAPSASPSSSEADSRAENEDVFDRNE